MIATVGFGRFGKLMVRYLSQDFPVDVYDSGGRAEEIEKAGGRAVGLEAACRNEIVILSVPISAFRQTLKKVAPLLAPGTLVVDVCSVKTYPVEWMRDLLPASASILGTHPMFGPDSAADSLQGRKILVWNERVPAERYEKIVRYLRARGLVVIESTPEDHDRQIAVSLSLTHFIGRALAEFGAEPLEIDTEGYHRLLHILEVVTHDTWQLFVDMHRYNPFAGEKRELFIQALKTIDERMADEDRISR